MSTPLDLRKCFTSDDYTQFLQRSANSITPIFYHIRDSKTKKLQACLVGTQHQLTALNASFGNTRYFFENGAVLKCFEMASRFIGETSDMVEFFGEEQVRSLAESMQSIDLRFIVEARRLQKEVRGLETVRQQNESFKRAEILAESNYEFPSLSPQECFVGFRRSFFNGLENDLLFFSKNCQEKSIYERLTISRNKPMAKKIVDFLREKKGPYPCNIDFIAIGAAHLPGDTGICKLLENHGYDVQRVFEDSPLIELPSPNSTLAQKWF